MSEEEKMTNFQHNLILGKSCNEHDRSLEEEKETWRKCVQKVRVLRVSNTESVCLIHVINP